MKKQKIILCFIVLCALAMFSSSAMAATQITNGIKYVNVTMWDINPLEYNRYARGGQGSSESVDSTRTLEVLASDLPAGGWANRDLGQNYNGQFSAIQGIVGNTLYNGLPTYNYPNSNGIALFPTDGVAASFPSVYPSIYRNYKFPFYKNSEGYYEFDSNSHVVSVDHANRRFNLYSGNNIGYTGFFPFNNVSDNLSSFESRNYNFSAYFEIPMYMNSTGLTKNPAGNFVDTVFNFRGDDDIWIFIDNTLVLDMGGCHGAVSGSINFRTKTATVSQGARSDGSVYCPQVSSFSLSEGNHTIKIFYCERATGESNFKATFNVMPSNLTVKHIDINSGKELASETVTDYPGEVKYTSAKDFVGYKVVQKPTSETIVLTEEDQTVYYYYDLIRVNLNINKTIDATASTSVLNLEGARFKVVATSFPGQVPLAEPATEYYSTVTDYTGSCVVEGLPYGTYTLIEDIIPNIAYSGLFFVNNDTARISTLQFTINEDKTYTYNLNDVPKKMNITVYKEDVETGITTQGDAHLEGAEYTIYKNANCTDAVETITTVKNPDGTYSATSGWYLTGTYYLKETKAPEGYLMDENLYTISQDPAAQTEEYVSHTVKSKDKVKRNDIEIIKNIGETSNTPQFPLDKCKFTATLVSSIGTDHELSVECTAETDRNGYCIIENLPYGTYIVSETTVSPISLKCADFRVFVQNDRTERTNPYEPKDGTFDAITLGETIGTTKEYDTTYNWLDLGGRIVDIPKVMQIKIRKVDKNGYENGERVDYTQGDAVLEGAIYQIYRYDPQTDDYTEYVYDITVDHKDSDGYWCAESEDLLVGKYMVKEKIKSTETVEGVTYHYSYAEGYLSDPETYYFEQQPDLQTVRLTYHKDVSKEEVIRGRVQVIKYDNVLDSSENIASEGAILRLTLDSSKGQVYYDVTIDKKGYGDFIDTNDELHSTAVKSCYGYNYLPYTIPYGKYTITEVKESNKEEHTSFFVQPEPVELRRSAQKEYRIEADEPVEMYIKIQKRDKDTGATVELEGAKFKVWDVEKEKFVSQKTYPSGVYIDEFETNDEGYVILPQKLEAGDYIIYETVAPEGYYLEEDFRIPSNSEDIGKKGKGGKYVVINKAAMGVDEDTPYNKKDLFYIVDMPNEPLKVKLQIEKKGEMLSEVLTNTTEYGEKYTPKYTMQGLKGVTYEIYAASEIKSPDGRKTYVNKGVKVDTITTGDDGVAITKELYPGEYEIKETITPTGYLTDKNIPNVELTNTDTLKRVETHKKELSDIRQKLELTFKKTFEEVNYANGEEVEKKAVFGVYTNQSINNYKGNLLISKDKLVDIIEINGDNADVTSTIDLPQGEYYVQELYASYPYSASDEKQFFNLEYTNNTDEFVVVSGDEFKNTYDNASITLIKLSTTTVDNIILNGDEIDTTEMDEKVQEILNQIKGMTETEIKEYFEQSNVEFVAGATYRVYTDEACQNALRIKNEETGEFEVAELVTDETGLIKLENVPLGHYYVKEFKAPQGYELSDEVIEIDLDLASKNTMIYQALIENAVVNPLITKIDIFTSEVVPNCVFEIADADGNVLLHSVTDEEGKSYIPIVMFEDKKTYTYTEIKAPEIYDIDKTPHEFTAKIDEEGNWKTDLIEVSNIRKKSKVTLTKLDMVDSTPIPNCKFELKSLENPNWEPIVGVTDKDGIYVFEDVPYGKYTYTELEAPEEYLIDTTPHEITIDAEDMKIVVYDERKPDTGDIAVVALVIVAVVCVLGVVFVIVKNKKNNAK